MAKKNKEQNKEKVVVTRLSFDEHSLIMEKATKYSGGNLSKYVRTLLLNKKVNVRIYDETGDKFCIAIGNFAQHIKKIGVNHNQIARFIQAKHPPQETKILLEEANKAYSQVLECTAEILKISKKIQQHYDSKN